MNLGKLRDRIQDVTSLSPFKLAKISYWAYRGLGHHGNGLDENSKLEARIADDFDDLPDDVAEQFWADALDTRFENGHERIGGS